MSEHHKTIALENLSPKGRPLVLNPPIQLLRCKYLPGGGGGVVGGGGGGGGLRGGGGRDKISGVLA